MTISKKDWFFVIGALIVFAIFWGISGEEKTKKMPRNADHQRFYDLLAAGKSKKEVDPLCAECHDGVKIPFPAKHPEKPGGAPMRCLFCHKTMK
jgi:hypothetical protein